jgi:hypothetical protein
MSIMRLAIAWAMIAASKFTELCLNAAFKHAYI